MTNYDAVSQAIIHLFDSEMFYAEIISSMKRINSTVVPIAGVCIKKNVELHINIPVFAALPLEQRSAILKHECEHVLRQHMIRMKELLPDVYSNSKKDLADNIINSMKHKVANIAADCAVNSNIKGLPEWCVFPDKFKLPVGQTVEWYLEELKQDEKATNMEKGHGEGGFDDHSIWDDSEGAKEILKEKIRQVVNKAAVKTRAAGKMTSDNELAVEELNKSLVNWREQLHRFVSRTIETKLESSRKKRNRRYGITIPGVVKIEELHVGVAVDTSGSMSDKDLQQAMSEIGEIAKYSKVTVVDADTEIKQEYEYNKNKKYKIKGRGGTAYQPALNHFNKHKKQIDALIYIGDMDNYDQEQLSKPKYPVLWAIIGDNSPPAAWGGQIRIKVK